MVGKKVEDRESTIAQLRARVAELESRKKEHRWEVHVRAFRWYGMTYEAARDKLKALLDLNVGEYAQIVEDP
jgi:hypothetical protein